MPAQGLIFVFYILFSAIILPATVVNFLIVNTSIIPQIKSFVITTGSMNPVIPKGSLVYTLKQNYYEKGEVVAFEDSLGTVIHRIVGVEKIGQDVYYITKGDVNRITDEELVLEEKIYGKVVLKLLTI
jgi:signal peptidase I